jgi:hypothetical protein
MDNTTILLLGTSLVLAGIFGIVEVLIRMRRQTPTASLANTASYANDTDAAPSIAPTDEDLEMVVVRERETNPDGRSRQDIIKDLQIGDPVVLLPESPGSEGRDEIRVVATGGTIGYVPPTKVARLLDILNDGTETHTEVSHIAQADDLRGVWINISVWR